MQVDSVQNIDLAYSFAEACWIARSCTHLIGDHGGVTLFPPNQQNQPVIHPAPVVHGRGWQVQGCGRRQDAASDRVPSPHSDPPHFPSLVTGSVVANYYASPPPLDQHEPMFSTPNPMDISTHATETTTISQKFQETTHHSPYEPSVYPTYLDKTQWVRAIHLIPWDCHHRLQQRKLFMRESIGGNHSRFFLSLEFSLCVLDFIMRPIYVIWIFTNFTLIFYMQPTYFSLDVNSTWCRLRISRAFDMQPFY